MSGLLTPLDLMVATLRGGGRVPRDLSRVTRHAASQPARVFDGIPQMPENTNYNYIDADLFLPIVDIAIVTRFIRSMTNSKAICAQ